MKEILKCPACGGTNIFKSSSTQFECRGCGYIFFLDMIGKKIEPSKPIWIETKPEPEPEPEDIYIEPPKQHETVCYSCDWTTLEEVKICEECGVEV